MQREGEASAADKRKHREIPLHESSVIVSYVTCFGERILRNLAVPGAANARMLTTSAQRHAANLQSRLSTPPAIEKSEHCYFAQTGHSHVAATQLQSRFAQRALLSKDVESWPATIQFPGSSTVEHSAVNCTAEPPKSMFWRHIAYWNGCLAGPKLGPKRNCFVQA